MIHTITVVQCDVCLTNMLPGDHCVGAGTHNCEVNAAAAARAAGWRREWDGQHLKDICPNCKEPKNT